MKLVYTCVFVLALGCTTPIALGQATQSTLSGPKVEIVPLAAETPAGLPVIPWVKEGDTAWHGDPPVFEMANEQSGPKAKGRLAVSGEAILFHVVVADPVHFNQTPDKLHDGDSLQLGIDALGASADGQPVNNVDAEVEKLYGKDYHRPKDIPQWMVDGEKKALRAMLEKQNKNPEDTLWIHKHDADYCVALSNGKPLACSYYHGQGTTGPKANLKLKIVRDESAKTTTYDFAIPWSDLEAVAGIAPTIKAALFVNDVNQAGEKVQKTFWGDGIGGKFAPFRFNRLAIGDPPVPFAAAMLTKATIDGPNDYAQAVIAVKNDAPTRIEASFGGQSAAVDVPAASGKAGVQRYAIRASGLAAGSAVLQAELLSGGQPLKEISARIFSGSTDTWYEFKPANDFSPSVVGLEDWIEKPAGKHGFIHVREGRMVADDGTAMRFWGSNGPGASNTTDPEHAAGFLEKYGIAAARLSLLDRMYGGFGSNDDSTQLDPKLLDRFDKHTAALRNHGIYYQACLHWNYPVMPGDAPKVLAYKEATQKGVVGGLQNFAPDIQDLRIGEAVNFLQHKNPYSNLTYAEDPALYCMEIQNESDIFWYDVEGAVQKCPTYKALFCKQFCDWLRDRYGTQDKLLAAWGAKALNAWPKYATDESLEGNTIYPALGAWFFGTGFKDQQAKGLGPRLLDTAEFLHQTQDKYYQRFEKAVRAAGYKAMLIGSNWQADSGVSHYYNLLSDRLMGVIDRHNYWGGMGMWFLHTGLLPNRSMLDHPGAGLLSTGFQQIVDRPFSMSEWMIEAPAQWMVEGPTLMAVYGLGLQGWSAVYASAFGAVGFTPTVQAGNVFNASTPAQLVLYPALARMVMRGDVKPGTIISSRNVSPENLKTGQFNFNETITQAGDEKDFGGEIPAAGLAVGRMVVQFVDKTTPSTFPDIGKALQDKVLVSNTGQLTWYFPGREEGHFTVNTEGTKAVVGFNPNSEFVLGDVKLQMDNKYGALFVTALEKGATLANCKSVLVTAMARARNTGMAYGDCSLDRLGRAPIIMEPVLGSVIFNKPPVGKVYLLDHDGKRTEKTVPMGNGKLVMDGRRDQTPYYEVVFE